MLLCQALILYPPRDSGKQVELELHGFRRVSASTVRPSWLLELLTASLVAEEPSVQA